VIITAESSMLGCKQTLQTTRQDKAKLVNLTNYLASRKSEIEYYAVLAKTDIHHYSEVVLN
jgi:large subunit ribosomal protein L30e